MGNFVLPYQDIKKEFVTFPSSTYNLSGNPFSLLSRSVIDISHKSYTMCCISQDICVMCHYNLLIYIYRANTMENLKDYFDKSRQLTENNDKDLYVLCTQCFEV